MKYFNSLIFLIVLISCSAPQEKEIPIIEGTIANGSQENLLLYLNNDQKELIDTVVVSQQGLFTIYQSSIDTTGFYSLEYKNKKIDLFLHPTDYIRLSFDAEKPLETAKSENSKITNALFDLERNTKDLGKSLDQISKQYQELIGKELNDSLIEATNKAKDSTILHYKQIAQQIIARSNSPIVTFVGLNQKWKNTSLFSLKKDIDLYLKNSEELINNKQYSTIFSKYDKELLSAYNSIRATQRYDAGGKLPKLKATTNWNESLNFEQMNANMVFLIFWNGEDDFITSKKDFISKISKKYGRYGMKTLMIAYINDKDLWQNNIKSINLPYWHLIDTLALQSPDLKELAINTLPFNLALGKDSTIIARNIWDDKKMEGFIDNFLKK